MTPKLCDSETLQVLARNSYYYVRRMCTNICLVYVIQMDLIRIERVKYTVSGDVVYYTTCTYLSYYSCNGPVVLNL